MLGIFFKFEWWAGADALMLVGFFLLLVSTVAFTARANTEAGTPSALNYLMVATVAVAVLALIFKSMHWQGGFALSMGAGVLLLLLSLMLLTSKPAVVASRQFVTVLVIFATLLISMLNLPNRQGAAVAAAPAQQEATAQ